ncbi:MAG TPA: YigZ family protein [Bacteroidales bacterium]|nr:YigZ family protein [Bacteroidales bacterium]
MSTQKDTYKSLKNVSEGFFKDRGSKFYAYAFPVSTEDEIKEKQAELRKVHYDARHHVYAWILGSEQQEFRANDDGEPAHSSGDPVLNQIRSFELTNLLIIVVRYFGGTKLGIPGLINAYKTAAAQAIENGKIIENVRRVDYRIKFDYPMMDQINRLVKESDIEVKDRSFMVDCEMTLAVRLSDADQIESRLRQSPEVKILDTSA